MSMTVSRRKDTKTPRYFQHKLADVRGGVSVNTSELGSDYLPEGAVLSAPDNGICHVVKVAQLSAAAAADATVINVKKGHQFVVGDFALTAVNGKAATITAIDKSNKTFDKITLDIALGAIALGGFIAGAAAKQTSEGAALKYAPFALNGTGKPVVAGQNFDTDAWVIAVTKGNPLPAFIASELKGIINY